MKKLFFIFAVLFLTGCTALPPINTLDLHASFTYPPRPYKPVYYLTPYQQYQRDMAWQLDRRRFGWGR